MTAQHLAWLLLGVASGVASGYPWGRWNGKRALDRAWDDGWDWGREDGYADALEDEEVMPDRPDRNAQGWPGQPQIVPRPGQGQVSGDAPAFHPDSPAGPGHPGWQERIAAELAPEALASDVPRARTGGRPVTPEQPGPGHPQCSAREPNVGEWYCTLPLGHGGGRHVEVTDSGRFSWPADDLADELAAEAEAHLARHVETHDEWIARMDYEHALWCAEAGLVNEWAAAA